MGDPKGAAEHVKGELKPDGTWMIVGPMANDSVEEMMHVVGRSLRDRSLVQNSANDSVEPEAELRQLNSIGCETREANHSKVPGATRRVVGTSIANERLRRIHAEGCRGDRCERHRRERPADPEGTGDGRAQAS